MTHEKNLKEVLRKFLAAYVSAYVRPLVNLTFLLTFGGSFLYDVLGCAFDFP